MNGLTKEYFIKRVGMFFLTVWLGTTVIFMVPRLAPGDPIEGVISRLEGQAGRVEGAAEMIEAWRERFGLNDPLPIQYLRYIRNSLTFELGYSLSYFPTTVQDLVRRAMPYTIGLLILSTFISFFIGNAVGALLAWRKTPWLLKTLLPLSLSFTAIPAFMLGILLLYIFAFGLKWLPFGGPYGRGLQPGWNLEFILSVIKHGILPSVAIVFTSMGLWGLGMRGMMITTDGEDYMILAQAKGLKAVRIFWLYGIRNAILPQVTALALSLGSIAGGALIVEQIFTYPGMGQVLYQGILNQDFTVIQGVVFTIIVGVALAVLILDLLYPLVDPRITFDENK